MDYKLIALDMDGTLLMTDKSVHPDTIRDIELAGRKGIYVVYCSGRAVPEILPYVPLLKNMRYVVCMSGALVYDLQARKSIFHKAIAGKYVQNILNTAEKEEGMIHFLTEKESIVRADQVMHMADYHMGVYQPMFLQVARTVTDISGEAKLHDSIPKINVYLPSVKARERAYQTLRHLLLSFAFVEETNLEITADGVTKAEGLKELVRYLGISMEETIAIGDADNDRAMLEAAGLAIAMGNAQRDIRELCDTVTGDNDHNGVGEAIWKYGIVE